MISGGPVVTGEPILPDDRLLVEVDQKCNFLLVCVVMTCGFVAHTVLLVAVPVHALSLGLSPLQLGAVLSTPYMLPLMLAIPLGRLVVRHGVQRSMLRSGLGMVLAALTMILLPGVVGLLAGQVLIGLCHLQMVLAAQALIASLATGKLLERYFGWYTTCLSGGQALGPLLSGWLIELRGSALDAFAMVALVAMVSTLSAFGMKGAARQGAPVVLADVGTRAQWRLFSDNRQAQVSILITLAAMFAISINGGYLPIYLDSLGVTPSRIGMLVSLHALVAMLVRPFTAQLIGLCGGRRDASAMALGLLALGVLLTGWLDNLWLLALLALLIGIGSGLSQPLSMVLLAESVSEPLRSSAFGVRLMANQGVRVVAPMLFGGLLALGGFGLAFAVSGGLGLLMLLWLRKLFDSQRPG